MRTLSLLGAAAVVGLLAGPAAAQSAAGDRVLCRFQDPAITESSGVAVGLASPGVIYTHNDSGDTARFFAVDRHTCRTVATYDVAGAHAVDWEDMAVARNGAGQSSVWLADIGDNREARSEIDLYRVDEPTVTPGEHTLPVRNVWRLRYPDGQGHDAEALLVTPSGAAYIVTKNFLGAEVYAVPRSPDVARVQTMRAAGRLPFVEVTGGAVSPDGRIVVLRTYGDAYVWDVSAGDAVPAVLRTDPTALRLPVEPQGEAVAVSGRRLIITTEGVHSPIHSIALGHSAPVPVPRVVAAVRKHDWRPFAEAGAAVVFVAAAVVLARSFRRSG
jgi:hypothetical protein